MQTFKQSAIDNLVASRKFVCRIMEDNSAKFPPPEDMRITFDIRRRDSPKEDIRLRLRALRDPYAKISKWGIALTWHGERIRGIDYKLRKDNIENGLYAGFIRHWHEHLWTEADRDKCIIDINDLVKNEDIHALLEFCTEHWNIEGYTRQYWLEGMR